MNVEEIRRLGKQLDREEIQRAREMPLEEKLLAGAELFDYACRITLDGIRNQYPEASEDRVQEILRERLAWAERNEERES
jgi:hypothetical protein